ncbi:MAG: GxxExxY protein [Ignavibacteria bacterium]|nr:GxxExxY protein [Ignavibacteria bacterium]
MSNKSWEENEMTDKILKGAFTVHTELGPGLLESAYEECLLFELKSIGLIVEQQKPQPLIYKEIKLETGYRIDLLVEGKIIVEIKSVEALNDLHLAQVMTYLKLKNQPFGLLINFNVKSLKDGIKRVFNLHHKQNSYNI